MDLFNNPKATKKKLCKMKPELTWLMIAQSARTPSA
jgi:hypothetical protein